MRLKLGSLTAIVVSSPEIAKIMLRNHDQVSCNRPAPEAIWALDHGKLSVVWLPVDNQWRKLRKICKENLFSLQKLDASQGLRREKLKDLFDYVNECCNSRRAVDIGRASFTTSLNLMSNTLFSVDFAALGSDSSPEFRDIVWGMMEVAGKPNLADYFPILKRVDPQGIVREIGFYMKKCLAIFDEIIDQRMQNESNTTTSKNDMLEALLDVRRKNESELTLCDIKHLFLDLFVAGSDTTSGTVEWAMAELIRNPDKMLKARREIN